MTQKTGMTVSECLHSRMTVYCHSGGSETTDRIPLSNTGALSLGSRLHLKIERDERNCVFNSVKVGALHPVGSMHARAYKCPGDIVAGRPHCADIATVKGVNIHRVAKVVFLCHIYKLGGKRVVVRAVAVLCAYGNVVLGAI